MADPGGCKRGRCTPPQLARTYQPSQTSLICQHLVCKPPILQLTHTSINSVWRGLTSSVGVKGSRFQLKQAARKTSQAATLLYNQGKCQKYDSVYNNLWLSSSFCLEEVMEMITVLSDCYYCCVQVQCVCAGNQGMLIFIIQIHKIFLLPRFAREGAHPPPTPSPSRGLTARAVQILSSWCTPPSHFLDPPLF